MMSLRGIWEALATLGVAVAIMALGVAVKVGLAMLTDANAGFVVYVPAVALAAWFRGFAGGLTATVVGVVAEELLFDPPLFVIATQVADVQLRLLAYLVGGVVVSYLSHRLRNERDRALTESAERRRALDDAAAAREELAQLVATERRASVLRDAFNSIISHELRTPITAIYGGAKLLARRDRPLDDVTRRELLDDVEAEADRLYRLVEDLLVLSRSERGLIERSGDPVAVQHVVERVVISEQERWPGVRLEAQAVAVAAARGDETYVEQVMRNLISNAAKYSPAGSLVSVVVDEMPEGIRVRVVDQGAGFDEAEAERLFELYYRSPTMATKIGGAGIGLFVCRALLEAMGGWIWARPRPGGGAEFGFVLQRYSEGEPIAD
jgi:K+-sensing histidine kinase KdpD